MEQDEKRAECEDYTVGTGTSIHLQKLCKDFMLFM